MNQLYCQIMYRSEEELEFLENLINPTSINWHADGDANVGMVHFVACSEGIEKAFKAQSTTAKRDPLLGRTEGELSKAISHLKMLEKDIEKDHNATMEDLAALKTRLMGLQGEITEIPF